MADDEGRAKGQFGPTVALTTVSPALLGATVFDAK
jgi:hypothetical protein